jgi:predicted nucleic acid-binding protein
MAYALIVLDTSAVMALVLAEEEGEEVEELIRDTIGINGQIFVPGLFWYELGNGLLAAERSDRISPRATSAAVSEFARFPVVTHQQSDFPTADRILNLAREHGLTYYDASYLDLALRVKAPLKSFDTHLQNIKSSFPLIL